MKIQIHITLSLVNCGTASNGDDEFCYCNTCSENEGDCDFHDECPDGLACGSNNCLDLLGFDSKVDCCYQSTIGDEHFCDPQIRPSWHSSWASQSPSFSEQGIPVVQKFSSPTVGG